MEEKVQEDWLDARLRDEAAYIDDAGFTSRVVHKLPARSVRRSYRAAILLVVTIAASVAAYFLAGGKWFVAERPGFRPGFIASPTTVFAKRPAKERSWLASMKLNWRRNTIRKPSIPLFDMISPTLSNCCPSTSAAPFCFAARMDYRMMRLRAFSRSRSAL